MGAVCHYSWKKEDLACWFTERATLCMVCAHAVKPKMQVSESVLVAGCSGRYIWLLEISNTLPRHRMSEQCMYC